MPIIAALPLPQWRFEKESRDVDEQAAYAVVAWLQRADYGGS